MSRAVVLSSHLDDALFSAFHFLSTNPDTVVVTVFAGVPVGAPPSDFDRLTGSTDAAARYEERRAEDEAVARLVGWQPIHLDFLDSPYVDSRPHTEDIVAAVTSVIADDVSQVWAPAGIGGHPDHLSVAAAGRALAHDLRRDLVVYADYPYAAFFGWPAWVTQSEPSRYLDVDAYLGEWVEPSRVRDAQVIRLDAEQQARKLECMRRYRTQFDSQEGGPSRRLSHPERLPYEMFWT
jgi:LmbE family N-acetylglucosaminyl deacetylase